MKTILTFAVFSGVFLTLSADITPVKINSKNVLRQVEIAPRDQSRNALQVRITGRPWDCKVNLNAKPMKSNSSVGSCRSGSVKLNVKRKSPGRHIRAPRRRWRR